MNHRTRVRLLQSGVAFLLLLFVAGLAWTMLQGQRDAAGSQPSVAGKLAEEALQASAEQISTGFEVTRTREGAPEITVHAERLLGLRGAIYLLQNPTLEIHHDGREPSLVTGLQGTFDMESGEGTVEGDAHAVLHDHTVVDSQRLEYRQGGSVDASGEVRVRRDTLQGESEELHYDPATEVLVLQRHVRVKGRREGEDRTAREPWALETEWLRYFSQQGRVQTQAFVLQSQDGTLSGERLELMLGERAGELRRLVSDGGARLQVSLPGPDGRGVVRVLSGDRIVIEPSDDETEEPRRILSRGNAHLFHEGGTAQDLRAEIIEWWRDPGLNPMVQGGEESSRIEARGEVILVLPAAGGASRLTASRLEAWLDADDAVQRGTVFDPVRYEGPEGTARCREAEFEDGGEFLLLRSETGPAAVLESAEGRIVARRLELTRSTGELVATMEVRTLHTGKADAGLFQSAEPVHGTADRVVVLRSEGRIRYEGAARLWQEENLLQADTIEIFQENGVLEAEGQVSTRSVVAGDEGAGPRLILASAEHLLYREKDRTAVYSRQARLRWGEQEVEADQIHVSLGEDRKVRRVLAEGDVKLRSPGRFATGQRLDYDVPGGEAILYGEEPLATAQNLENQQLVKGQSLTMDLAGGTIDLESGPGGRTWITLAPSTSTPGSHEAPRAPAEGEAEEDRSLETSAGHRRPE